MILNLNQLTTQFLAYADGFLTGVAEHDQNIILKRDHSRQVMRECLEIAAAEKLDDNSRTLAGTIGLLHDIGRFEQYRQHRTLVDYRSVNHGELGEEIVESTGLLDDFNSNQRQLIRTAIRHHNCRQIALDLDQEALFFTKLVRDADKLDIMRIALEHYAKPELDETVMLHLPDSEDISPKIYQSFMKGENSLTSEMKTVTDFKVVQLGWVFDLNFNHSIREFKRRGFHDAIRKHLPDTPAAKTLYEKTKNYLNSITAIGD